MKKIFVMALLVLGSAVLTRAQQLGIKTNALYWATSTPNLGLEIGLGRKTTLDLSGGYNPWTLDRDENRKIKHWKAVPEFRYWLCERFNGHFFGVHTGYMFYNMSGVRIPFRGNDTVDHRYQGWATGVGVSYGYSWVIGKRWNIEANVGVGYIYTNYDRYECRTCGKFRGTNDRHMFGPTKLGVSVIYLIK